MSTRSMIGRRMPVGPVPCTATQSSGGGMSGAGTSLHHGSVASSRRPSVNVASTNEAPSRTSRARAWLIRRPRRRTSTWTCAGPGVGDAM